MRTDLFPEMTHLMSRAVVIGLLLSGHGVAISAAHAEDFDLVIRNGRVMNPANGLDSVRDVGIRDGRIAELSREPLRGKAEVDATGLVVAPGFIDLHAHGQREFEAWLQAQDGVTTQLEMEVGVHPVDVWYENRAGKAPIHYGATASHIVARIATLVDLPAMGLTEADLADGVLGSRAAAVTRERSWVENPATTEEIAAMGARLQQGLDQGALGIGFGINYTPGATREEIFRMFALAKANKVTAFVHSRGMTEDETGGAVSAVQELLANAAATGAGLHIVHIGSSGGSRVPLLLEMIDSAQRNGIDVTTEVYPYTAWSTFIGAALFDGDFTRQMGLGYGDIELPETGERLDEERFHRLRAEAPHTIIVGHGMKEENVTAAIAHPGVMIASDGMLYHDGRAHPRGAGTFSRVLGYYVRERGALSLMEALGKMSYLPAKRLEAVVPQMQSKGRIEIGADADLVVFDPETIIDRATFAEPALPSGGIAHVVVNGVFVVRDGELQKDVFPGQPIRRE